MTILYVLYWVSFSIMLICFPAVNFINVRRWYGRIFNTRIDTTIYHILFYISAICVLFLCITIRILI
jgi:hypothetical protein